MSGDKDDIDSSLTTWEGSRRAQLRYALTLTLRQRLVMADVVRRFQEMRAQGKFKGANDKDEQGGSGSASEGIGKE